MKNKDNTDTFNYLLVSLSPQEVKVLLNLLNDCSTEECDNILNKLKTKLEEKTIDVFDDINGIWNMF